LSSAFTIEFDLPETRWFPANQNVKNKAENLDSLETLKKAKK
jgi:hypothetical protein